MAKNGLIIGIGVALFVGVIALSKGGSRGNRKIKVPIPYPNGTLTEITESQLAQYGYVVDPSDGKVYHSNQYPPPASATGGQSFNPIAWATMLQGLINQGMTAAHAVTEAVAPSITVTPNWAGNSASVVLKAGLGAKTATINKGASADEMPISNTAYYSVLGQATTSKITIYKVADDTVLKTVTINWANRTVV